jgi:hypothetical protein
MKLRQEITVKIKTGYPVRREDARAAVMFEQLMQLVRFRKFEKTLNTKK